MNAKAKVLVVDDEEPVRACYLRILVGRQCQVREAGSGADALQLLQQQDFDVVLLEQKLAGLDGMATLRQIKQQWPQTEVILVSSCPAVDAAKQAVLLGACDYLAKPVAPQEVLHATGRALTHKRWSLHRGPAAASAAAPPAVA